MPSLFYSRTGSTVQIYDNEWGANPGRQIIKSNALSGTQTLDAQPKQSDALPLRYASAYTLHTSASTYSSFPPSHRKSIEDLMMFILWLELCSAILRKVEGLSCQLILVASEKSRLRLSQFAKNTFTVIETNLILSAIYTRIWSVDTKMQCTT